MEGRLRIVAQWRIWYVCMCVYMCSRRITWRVYRRFDGLYFKKEKVVLENCRGYTRSSIMKKIAVDS